MQPDGVLLEHTTRTRGWVLVTDGVVTAVGDGETPAPPDSDHTLDIEGVLLPGLIDLQTNGAGGHNVDEATPTALDVVARRVWAGGATAFLPTLITAPFDMLCDQLDAVVTWIEARTIAKPTAEAATPLGVHLEGPFLEIAGAHDASWFCDPDPGRLDRLLQVGRGRIALVTLAPGRRGAAEAVTRLRAAGIAVALGHARSTTQFGACVNAGASLVTHLFNAMGPLHHRDPGIAGLALDEPRLRCSMIPDGVHVDPVMVRNAFQCLGPERLVLVTDSVAAAGMPDGRYELGGQPVELTDGAVRDQQGRLAGSSLTMAAATACFVDMVPGTDAATLARIASHNPAVILGRADLGRLAPGTVARFAVVGGDGTATCLTV